MKAIILPLALFLFSLFPCGVGAETEYKFPSLKAEDGAEKYTADTSVETSADVSAGNLTWKKLAETALWSSGVNMEAEGARYMAEINSLVQEIQTTLSGDGIKDGESILKFMYDKKLKKYSTNQTTIDTVLDRGTYNCVSSAVLYLILASGAGLDVHGVMTRDHAFIALKLSENEIDIETTNSYGFDPGSKKEFTNSFGKTTGFAYVSKTNYRNRADISPIELVSLILENRIAEANRRRDYDKALALALNREVILKNRTNPTDFQYFAEPEKTVRDLVFVKGGSMLNSGREREALAFADYAKPFFPDDARWEEFQFTAVYNLVSKALNAKKFDEAESVAAENEGRVSQENQLKIRDAINNSLAVDYHNRFAALFNKRRYDEADEILKAALAAFPGNKQLQNDLKTLRTSPWTSP
jgi:tetratricopeptide (TPR) repeat protein